MLFIWIDIDDEMTTAALWFNRYIIQLYNLYNIKTDSYIFLNFLWRNRSKSELNDHYIQSLKWDKHGKKWLPDLEKILIVDVRIGESFFETIILLLLCNTIHNIRFIKKKTLFIFSNIQFHNSMYSHFPRTLNTFDINRLRQHESVSRIIITHTNRE